MNKIQIIDEYIIRNDGSKLDRNLLIKTYYNDKAQKKGDPGCFGCGGTLLFFGILMILIITQVDKTEISNWPMGNATIPVSFGCLLLGGYLVYRKRNIRNKTPYVPVFINTDEVEAILFETNDKNWASKTAVKLRELSDPNSGNWIIDADEKSITQI